MGGGRGKSKMSIICKLDIACKHLARKHMTSSPPTRVQGGKPGSDKKSSRVSDQAANTLLSYLHRSIANRATRKSAQFNIGLKELRQFLCLHCLSKLVIRLTHDVFLISLLFIIVSCLHQLHFPLFMINKVNVTLL